ncbi:unnamed protein product [Mytilus coruscus]|uniref:C-type lectin domain-containing protein n=1 Tax=Mytilus coruscus TaxID=42192 RepID=A0A6J8AEY3_MYTCO|nr:unnamed protein product [Mytilus coruscus]
MDVQGKIETSKIVDTYLQCARYFQQSDVCDGIFFNNTTGYCAIIENNDGNVIKDTILGEFFYRKKKKGLVEKNIQPVHDGKGYEAPMSASQPMRRLVKATEKTGMVLWWIGRTDASQEGIFRWIKNGENVTYSNWDIDQPDDGSDGIPGADCMRYIIKSKTKAAWWDRDCNNEFAFICENKMFSLS